MTATARKSMSGASGSDSYVGINPLAGLATEAQAVISSSQQRLTRSLIKNIEAEAPKLDPGIIADGCADVLRRLLHGTKPFWPQPMGWGTATTKGVVDLQTAINRFVADHNPLLSKTASARCCFRQATLAQNRLYPLPTDTTLKTP